MFSILNFYLLFDWKYLPEIKRKNVYFKNDGLSKLLVFEKELVGKC